MFRLWAHALLSLGCFLSTLSGVQPTSYAFVSLDDRKAASPDAFGIHNRAQFVGESFLNSGTYRFLSQNGSFTAQDPYGVHATCIFANGTLRVLTRQDDTPEGAPSRGETAPTAAEPEPKIAQSSGQPQAAGSGPTAPPLGEAKAREVRLVLTPQLRGEGDQLAAMTTQLMLGLWDIGERLGAALTEEEAHEAERWKKAGGTAMRLHHWLVAALESDPREDPPFLRTVEREWGRSGERAVVQVRPLRVDEVLDQLLWSPRQVLAVSATLATPGGKGIDRFAYWRSRVGVQGGLTRVIASPFPYRERVRLYIPQEVARFDPTRPEVKGGDGLEAYRARLTARIGELLAVRRGGAFVLCTSLGMVRHLAPVLQTMDERVMIQGDAPPAELIRRFKADGQAILVGTRTFWEGVDVQGDALTMVLIDRLPFAVPDDPLWEAWVREAGETWFVDLALPMTLLALKQAFGRLMRRMDDWGVVGLLDARVIGKSYGRWLLSGLPPAPVIRTVAEVKVFCQERRHRNPR